MLQKLEKLQEMRRNKYLHLIKIEQTAPHTWRVTARCYPHNDLTGRGVVVTAETTNGVAVEAVRVGGNWYYKTANEAARALWVECLKKNKLGRCSGRQRKTKPPRIDGAARS